MNGVYVHVLERVDVRVCVFVCLRLCVCVWGGGGGGDVNECVRIFVCLNKRYFVCVC